MKPSIGCINFEHTTENDKLVTIEAQVYYDSYGEPTIDIVELNDEEGNQLSWHSLPGEERYKIESYIYNNCTPQDELYDDYDDTEMFND